MIKRIDLIRRIGLVFLCGLVYISDSCCQSFLNGNFEINIAGCMQFISNAAFDSVMFDIKAIGNYEMLCIQDTAAGCNEVQDGRYAINLVNYVDPTIFDVISFKLSDSLHAGSLYTISFYQKYIGPVGPPDSIEIGISDNDSTLGIYAGISSPFISTYWTQRIVNFYCSHNR
jgi:hypothetical protein